jgi:phosphatidyl-myo-inositol dimannoside synthase
VSAERAGRLLVITNDFPPRRGGIESFVSALCERLPGEVVVYTARMAGSDVVDRRLGYPVLRDRSRMLLPTPRVSRAVRAAAGEHGCDRVLFGASMPLGLLASGLRAAGIRRMVGLTHGHEVWWSVVPGARQLLRRVGREVDVLTFVSDYCRVRIARALRPEDARSMVRLSPGVDPDIFTPGLDGSVLRERLGIAADQPVVLAASRLVARKGQDVLLKAWPRVLVDHPRAILVLVGTGPARRRLTRAVAAAGMAGSVRLMTSVGWPEMPTVYAAGDVFALPCRTRLWGLEPEALGIVFLEAAASGLPIVVGDSGGAPETVVPGETGYVADPRSPADVADRISSLLADPVGAAAMGRRGRAWVTRRYSWETAVTTMRALLAPDSPD